MLFAWRSLQISCQKNTFNDFESVTMCRTFVLSNVQDDLGKIESILKQMTHLTQL